MKQLNRSLLAVALVMVLASCDQGATIEPNKQIGPNPELPQAQNFLLPPMQVPKGVPWQEGEMPKVAVGLKIEKVAEGLMHPRQVYVLPNNDVLVAESNGPPKPTTQPKQLITGVIKNASGKGGPGGNRITLLRNVEGNWQKHANSDNKCNAWSCGWRDG